MRATVFVTGATGFVGRALLPILASMPDLQLRLLLRDPRALPDPPANARIIEGDLADPATFAEGLRGADAVLHLAALTGKADAKAHDQMNRQATEALIAAADDAGVRRFLFVSSIAAGYADKRFYPYATAKRAAEVALAGSGMRYAILRPTLVLGPSSPILDALGTLASLPVIPLPNRGAQVAVQPIDVSDVARGIATVLTEDRFDDETLELGGPTTVPIGALLRLIAEIRTGRPAARCLPLPLRFVQWPLAVLEPLARPVMPATAGQFALFGNSSDARDNWLFEALRPGMTSLRDMIAPAAKPDSNGGTNAPVGPETSSDMAAGEARTLGRHMTGQVPSQAAVAHYVAALQKLGMVAEGPRFDQFVLVMARRGGAALWLADAFAGFAHRRGTLRRRQILLAAILENDAIGNSAFDDSPGDGPAAALLRLAGAGLKAGVLTLAGLVVFLPIRLYCAHGRNRVRR